MSRTPSASRSILLVAVLLVTAVIADSRSVASAPFRLDGSLQAATSRTATAPAPEVGTADRLLVRLREEGDANALADAFGRAFELPVAAAGFDSDPLDVALHLDRPVDLERALGWLRARPEVAYAEPDYVLESTGAPNDPLYGTNQQYLSVIHAPEAWDMQTGDPSIVVAVLDTGIDVTHPDLAPNIWENPAAGAGDCGLDVHGCNFVAPDSSTVCPPGSPIHSPDVSPLTWHGTFVAGVVGARGNNGQGVTGVAWNASIMPVRMANCRGATNASALDNAVHYAVDHGARVIVVGVGASRTAGAGCREPSRFMADSVQYARDHGVLVVAGTGNADTSCVTDPAAAPGALAVGGASWLGKGQEPLKRWSAGSKMGSNWGPEVAVAAPANNIISTVLRRPIEAPPNDLYGSGSGTSFAAPLVAGEAVLLLSQNPLLSPDWLETLIAMGAHPQPDGLTPNWAGAGVVDIAASLRLMPAAIHGVVLEGGTPASPGALVEAYVNGVQCAQSSAFAGGDQTMYTLIVPVAAMQSGCGAPGATVELRVDGSAVTTVAWTPTAIAVDLDAPAMPQ